MRSNGRPFQGGRASAGEGKVDVYGAVMKRIQACKLRLVTARALPGHSCARARRRLLDGFCMRGRGGCRGWFFRGAGGENKDAARDQWK